MIGVTESRVSVVDDQLSSRVVGTELGRRAEAVGVK